MGDDVSELLEPMDGQRLPSVRNGTRLSRFCDRLVAYFVEHGATQARVAADKTGFPFEVLYKGLWNATNKREFSGRVAVRKVEGEIVLIRRKR